MSVETGTGVVPRDHVVQFYERDDELITAVTQFVLEGLVTGEAAIVVATAAHSTAIEMALADTGLDVVAARRADSLTIVDAREALARSSCAAGPMPMRSVAKSVGSSRGWVHPADVYASTVRW